MRVLAVLIAVAIASASHAQVPCRWDAEASSASFAKFSCYRGETLSLQPTFLEYGTAVTNYSPTVFWQTNGMGSAWWSTNALVFSPAMDVGASSYTLFVRAAMSNGVSYRASATIKMLGSPGATPNAIALPTERLDFASIIYTNAPWLLAESDPSIPAAIDSAVAQAGTNAQSIADQAQANAIDFASTNKMTRIYNPSNSSEWIDGAGNMYVVSNFWNMTFAPDFAEGYSPAQTNYLFTSLSQSYYEGGSWGKYWLLTPNRVEFKPSSLSTLWLWVATTNEFVLQQSLFAGESYVFIQHWTTTNIVSLATTAQVEAKADSSRTIIVNGATGTLTTNLTFNVTGGMTGSEVTNAVEALRDYHRDSYTNVIWQMVYSNGWMWLVAYTNYPAN